MSACAKAPRVEVADFGSPSPSPAATISRPRPIPPHSRETSTPVDFASRPHEKVEVNFGGPATGGTPGSESPAPASGRPGQIFLAAASQPQPPAGEALSRYELPSTTAELYLGFTVPRRASKGLLKATCTPPLVRGGGKPSPMTDSASAQSGWVEFSFQRPQGGWAQGEYALIVESDGKELGKSSVVFLQAKEDEPLEGKPPGQVILSDQKDARKDNFDLPGGTPTVFLEVDSGKNHQGISFKSTWFKEQEDHTRKRVFELSLEPTDDDNSVLTFHLNSNQGAISPGIYSVEVRVADKLVYRHGFTIASKKP